MGHSKVVKRSVFFRVVRRPTAEARFAYSKSRDWWHNYFFQVIGLAGFSVLSVSSTRYVKRGAFTRKKLFIRERQEPSKFIQ